MKTKYNISVNVNATIPILTDYECAYEEEAKKKAMSMVYNKLQNTDWVSHFEMNTCNVTKKIEDEVIMGYKPTNNGLAQKINEIYNNNSLREQFYKVVKILIERDIDEINKFLQREIKIEDVLKENVIYDYLTHIADDSDLMTIILFVR